MITVVLTTIEDTGNQREAEKAAASAALAHIIPGAIIGHDDNGAPFIEGLSELNISISHSRDTVAVAVSDNCVAGIDIETARPAQLARVARRFLSGSELEAAGQIPDGLLRAWTAKEAVYKAGRGRDVAFIADIVLTGPGFDTARAADATYEVRHFVTGDGAFIAVATETGKHNKITFVTLYEREQIPLTVRDNPFRADATPSTTVNKTHRKLVFATNNAHKLSEMRRIVDGRFEILSLADIGCHDDIPEDADTLEGNAVAKAHWIAERYGYDCFADDTGLEVDALNGEPGVHSARYAPGTDHNAAANTALLLHNLDGVSPEKRTARFRTVIALVMDGHTHTFEGRVEGVITDKPAGNGGFGYDPVFRPVGFDLTFAEIGAEAKNAISHRGRATQRLMEFMDTIDR